MGAFVFSIIIIFTGIILLLSKTGSNQILRSFGLNEAFGKTGVLL